MTARNRTAVAHATDRADAPSGGFIRLDADYILRVRPWLGDGEARVYEALVLLCDGWERATNGPAIANITGLRVETVRRAIKKLEQLGLVSAVWTGRPHSPHAGRTFQIVRDYDVAIRALAHTEQREHDGAALRARIETERSWGSRSYDHETHDRAIAPLITRSPRSISPVPSLPSPTAPLEQRRTDAAQRGTDGAAEGRSSIHLERGALADAIIDSTAPANRIDHESMANSQPDNEARPKAPHTATSDAREIVATSIRGVSTSAAESSGAEPYARLPTSASAKPASVPTTCASHTALERLVSLARSLWTDVSCKGARRYISQLLVLGEPPATGEEVARYLQWSAKTARVQRARFPIAVACMAEEFEDWLHRYRRMRLLPGGSCNVWPPAATTAKEPRSTALSSKDLEARAREFCHLLEHGPGPASTARSKREAATRTGTPIGQGAMRRDESQRGSK